jgi:uncharacterized protein YprB with RNaseH-like and TPR domain
MLTSTFVHVPGVGYTTERQIWEQGGLTWYRFLEIHQAIRLSDRKRALILPYVEESIERLKQGDHKFFAKNLSSRDHWRAISEFGNQMAYLDIETTGCGWDDRITVIGVYDGYDMHSFIRGHNLEAFPEFISRFKILVTFAGSSFDLPFIRRTFPSLELDQLHVDLMCLLRRIGFRGGLKSIERQMGIRRPSEVECMDGYDAVRLWHEYQCGSSEALELLLLYNKEDVVNMHLLLKYGYKRLKEGMMLLVER